MLSHKRKEGMCVSHSQEEAEECDCGRLEQLCHLDMAEPLHSRTTSSYVCRTVPKQATRLSRMDYKIPFLSGIIDKWMLGRERLFFLWMWSLLVDYITWDEPISIYAYMDNTNLTQWVVKKIRQREDIKFCCGRWVRSYSRVHEHMTFSKK